MRKGRNTLKWVIIIKMLMGKASINCLKYYRTLGSWSGSHSWWNDQTGSFFLSFYLSFSLSLRLSSCCIKGSHSSSKRTQTNQIFSLTLTDIFTQISICQPKVCWAEGKGGGGYTECSSRWRSHLPGQPCPVLCCVPFTNWFNFEIFQRFHAN